MLVEHISLTLAIGGLFSTYIDYFNSFEAAQSLAEDLKNLLIKKFDVKKARLLIWSNTVGVQEVEYSERISDLRDSATVEVVTKCLERIQAIFSDTEKLERSMGSKLQSSARGLDSGVDLLSRKGMHVIKTPSRHF